MMGYENSSQWTPSVLSKNWKLNQISCVIKAFTDWSKIQLPMDRKIYNNCILNYISNYFSEVMELLTFVFYLHVYLHRSLQAVLFQYAEDLRTKF